MVPLKLQVNAKNVSAEGFTDVVKVTLSPAKPWSKSTVTTPAP